MRNLFLFLLKFFVLSVGFFLLWILIEKPALAALGKIVLVPVTLFGYRPTGMEVVGKTIRFVSAIPGRTCNCDVELAPIGFIVFLSLAFSTSPVALSRRLKATGLGLLLLLCFHAAYLSLRVLFFAPGGFQGADAYLIRFFVPAGILFPVVLWVIFFPTNLLQFAKTPESTLRADTCPICGSRRGDVFAHIRDTHGKGKKGFKSRAAKRYLELFGKEEVSQRR
ncbi:MAG: hypothetical protein NTX17_03210 [Candidatus Eisenbacteria bacterium]|nr:hypothetical protein [Candidatus Eisenbacteria bacterium]